MKSETYNLSVKCNLSHWSVRWTLMQMAAKLNPKEATLYAIAYNCKYVITLAVITTYDSH